MYMVTLEIETSDTRPEPLMIFSGPGKEVTRVI